MVPAYLNLLAWTYVFMYLNNTRAWLPVFLAASISLLNAAILVLRTTHLTRKERYARTTHTASAHRV